MSSWRDTIWDSWQFHDESGRLNRVGRINGIIYYRQWDTIEGPIVDRNGTSLSRLQVAQFFRHPSTPRIFSGSDDVDQDFARSQNAQEAQSPPRESHYQAVSHSTIPHGVTLEARPSSSAVPYLPTTNVAALYPEFRRTQSQNSSLFPNTARHIAHDRESRHQTNSDLQSHSPARASSREVGPAQAETADPELAARYGERHAAIREHSRGPAEEGRRMSSRDGRCYYRNDHDAEIETASSRTKTRGRDECQDEMVEQASRLGLGYSDEDVGRNESQMRHVTHPTQKPGKPIRKTTARRSSNTSDDRNPRHSAQDLAIEEKSTASLGAQEQNERHSSSKTDRSQKGHAQQRRVAGSNKASPVTSHRHHRGSLSSKPELQPVQEGKTMAFNARKIITDSRLSGGGQEEELNPRYKVKDSKFFKLGRVFAMLWHSEDTSDTRQNRSDISDVEGPQYSVSRFNSPVYTTVRRMVVVKEYHGHSLCVPIVTNSEQGAMKPGLSRADVALYTVVYMEKTTPWPLEGEQRLGMTKDPIEVRPAEANQRLSSMSRLNFGKPYTVEHNVKVMNVGQVMGDFLVRLQTYFWNTLDRPVGIPR